MGFDDADRPFTLGMGLAFVSAVPHLLMAALSFLGLVGVAGVALFVVPSMGTPMSSTDQLMILGAVVFGGVLALVDLAVGVAVPAMALRLRHGGEPTGLIVLLVVLAALDAGRCLLAFVGFSCMTLPLYIAAAVTQLAAALALSLERERL